MLKYIQLAVRKNRNIRDARFSLAKEAAKPLLNFSEHLRVARQTELTLSIHNAEYCTFQKRRAIPQ